MKEGSGTRIYNKSKFRLHDFSFNDNTLNLQVGVTDYKDLHGTNLSEDSAELVDNSEVGGKRFKRLSQAIGEQGGKLDRPGGHPEPEEAVKDNGLNNETELNNEHVGAELFASEQVKTELFAFEQKEIRDEINIPLENQSNQELIGIVFNLNKGGRVGLEFKINVNLSSEQVLEIY
ncbi:nucleoside diphosphate-linked moiety X motif 22, partial [Eurytemora carolleeae]|uniref:nucleoside diphosphate-linked moiety X motif 22 n=1 Tax=Eurytemora carolleeae TaxID=1294199 RepID=UPI000C755C24